MTPEQKRTRVLRIVAVSPGDLTAERDALQAVIDELNRDVAPSRGCVLSLWRWETDARPGLHLQGPQGLIDHVMKIYEADVVVGIFWKRFGTPTSEADSGTEHELRKAWEAWKEHGQPDVMVYFCERPHTPRTATELEQWKRVLDFREALLPEQLYWEYVEVEDFERQVRGHLTNVLSATDGSSDVKMARRATADDADLLSQRATRHDLSTAALTKFREDVREDAAQVGDPSLTPHEMLDRLGLLDDGVPRRAAILLFGVEPQREVPGAAVHCVQYLGADRTEDRHSRASIDGNLREQIDVALAFVRDRVPRREHPAGESAKSQVEYAYPMTCVREVVINALVHRDYGDAERHVHIRLYSDRIEVLSPGAWYAGDAIDGEVPLRKLESQSVKRNPLLARTMSLIRYFEGEGSGVPTAVRDAKRLGAPEPVARYENGFVVVTIFPLAPSLRSRITGLMAVSRLSIVVVAVVLALGALGATFASIGGSPSATVNAGAIYSLTGTGAGAGRDALDGARFAVDYINGGDDPESTLPLAAGGGLPRLDGAKLKLVVADARGDRCQAQPAFNRLVDRDHVAAVVGAYESTVTLQALIAADKRKVPLVNDSATAPSLTQPGGSITACKKAEPDPRPSPWFFRVGPSDAQAAAQFFDLIDDAALAHEIAPVRKVAILHESNDIYGNTGAAATEKLATSRDIAFRSFKYSTVLGRSAPSSGSSCAVKPGLVTRLRSLVRKIKAYRPDVVFALGYLPDAVAAVQTMRKLGYVPPALLTYGAGFVDRAFIPSVQAGAPACGLPAAAPAGIIAQAAWSPDLSSATPAARDIAARFTQRYKRPMTHTSASAFTAMLTLAQAINNAGSTDPARIRAALSALDVPANETIMPWAGIKFDANGQNLRADVVLQQVQAGRYRVVYPPSVSTRDAIWPLAKARR